MNYTTKIFFRDAAERALKTFAQSVIAFVTVTDPLSMSAFADLQVWSVGGAAALLSVLSSLASRKVGSDFDASVAF